MNNFKLKYPIESKLIPVKSKRRSGNLIDKVVFIVAHDTGNKNSTALNNVDYFIRTCNGDATVKNWMPASAHIFVDDKSIIECVPVTTGPPEKAWHVLYNLKTDDLIYGANANDAAIGVELCYGTKIDSDEAYRRYVWLIAFLCDKFNLKPENAVSGHFILDPQRKTDPVSGLAFSRRTYENLLHDIKNEYDSCLNLVNENLYKEVSLEKPLKALTTGKLNVRQGAPTTKSQIVTTLPPNVEITLVAQIKQGLTINGNSLWYKLNDGNFIWSGGVKLKI
jgi:N-acetylmuramoyl-L-alanine amidase